MLLLCAAASFERGCDSGFTPSLISAGRRGAASEAIENGIYLLSPIRHATSMPAITSEHYLRCLISSLRRLFDAGRAMIYATFHEPRARRIAGR